jgi:hypothetical protein
MRAVVWRPCTPWLPIAMVNTMEKLTARAQIGNLPHGSGLGENEMGVG